MLQMYTIYIIHFSPNANKSYDNINRYFGFEDAL